MTGFVLPVVTLGVVAVFAIILAATRNSPLDRQPARIKAARCLAIALTAQAIHFAEEALTDFHARFPDTFGLPPMPLRLFLIFNLAWLAIWLASIPGIIQANRFAFFAAWFLAIAGSLNLIAHPLLALATQGYFPGLITSPLVGLAGILLWWSLARATVRTKSHLQR